MTNWQEPDDAQRFEWERNLFLEDLTANLLRLKHLVADGMAADDVRVYQEYALGGEGRFAALKVQLPDSAYYAEVLYGLSHDQIINLLSRTYGPDQPNLEDFSKLLLVVDTKDREDWPATHQKIESVIHPDAELEIWDEAFIRGLLKQTIGLEADALTEAEILRVGNALDEEKGRFAFGDKWENSFIQRSMLWNFDAWRLRQFFVEGDQDTRSGIRPRMYPDLAVLMADLSSYSSFVNDTSDSNVIHRALTSFCTKARTEILHSGGMLFRFTGDEVVGFYGIPDRKPGYAQDALEAARALVDIGNSVEYVWQQAIDQIQPSMGVHIGVAMGDLEVVSLRPFEPVRVDVFGDAINLAARLQKYAGPNELVASNSFYRALDMEAQAGFEKMEPVEAKNIGRVQAWKHVF